MQWHARNLTDRQKSIAFLGLLCMWILTAIGTADHGWVVGTAGAAAMALYVFGIIIIANQQLKK